MHENPCVSIEERTAPITGLHGMAGGGMGPYTVCANCGMILSKSQDAEILCDSHEDDEPPKGTPEYQKWVETKVQQLRGDDDEQTTSDDQAVNPLNQMALPSASKGELEDQFRAHASDLGLVTQVFSEGPINASIAIVGEGPGESEVAKGRPFIGGSGKLLFETLKVLVFTVPLSIQPTLLRGRYLSHARATNETWSSGKSLTSGLTCLSGSLLGCLTSRRSLSWETSHFMPFSVRRRLRTGVARSSKLLRFPGNRLGTYVVTINPAYAMRELKLEPVFTLDIRNRLGCSSQRNIQSLQDRHPNQSNISSKSMQTD